MNVLDNVLALNGITVLGVRGKDVTITHYDEKVKIPHIETNDTELPDIKEILLEFKGKRNCIINSDVFDVINEKVKIKNLEKHTLKRILDKVVEESVTFLAEISALEGQDVLIQTTYDKENPALTISVQLVDDISVLLLDIHYERNERMIKC